MLKEIRIHGRGGQGAVTSSQLLAIAAFFDKKHSQAFPNFGVERRGAPVEAFARISDSKIFLRQQVYSPDYVIVLDSTLLGSIDAAKGLKEDGAIFVNTDKSPKELSLPTKARVYTADITKSALEVLGKPFANVAVLGCFSAISKEVSLESLKKAVLQEFSGSLAEKNNALLEKVYSDSKKIAEKK